MDEQILKEFNDTLLLGTHMSIVPAPLVASIPQFQGCKTQYLLFLDIQDLTCIVSEVIYTWILGVQNSICKITSIPELAKSRDGIYEYIYLS